MMRMNEHAAAAESSQLGRSEGRETLMTSVRIEWIDVMRGGLICLIIFFHVTLVFVVNFLGDDGDTDAALESVLAGLRPIRMPLFFFISGVLAAGAVARTWGYLLASRSALFTWVYLIWSIIHTAVASLTSGYDLADAQGQDETSAQAEPWVTLLSTLLAPTFLWFIFALALYFPLAKLVRRLGWIPLIPSVSAYLLSVNGWPNSADSVVNQLPAVAAFFCFFYLGLLTRQWVFAEAARPRRTIIALGLGLFLLSQAVEALAGRRIPALLFTASTGAVIFGIASAVWAARAPALSTGLRHLGRRTLPIFTLHMPIVWALLWATETIWPDLLITSIGVAVCVDLGICAIVMMVCLGTHRLLSPVAPWLWQLPRRASSGTAADRDDNFQGSTQSRDQRFISQQR